MARRKTPRAAYIAAALWLAFSTRPSAAAPPPATELVATPQSASSISLAWKDTAGEVGYYVQRSTDGTSFSAVDNVPANTQSYVDSGRSPSTLYYYRVVAYDYGGSAPPSNAAAAFTHAASALKVCARPISDYHSMARFPSVAHNGTQWGMAWSERRDGEEEEIYFQLLDQTTGAPVGEPKRITTTGAPSQYPTLRWNGSKFGLVWGEGMRGEGGVNGSGNYFALLDAAGNKIRGDVRILGGPTTGFLNSSLETAFVPNGSGWGVFLPKRSPDPLNPSDLAYYRLDEDGDILVNGASVATSPDWDLEVSAAWNGTAYGVAWVQARDTTSALVFQPVALDGTPLGSKVEIPGEGASINFTSAAPDGTGWAVAAGYAETDGSEKVFLARFDAAGGLTGIQQVSDDWDARYPAGQVQVADQYPQLVNRPGGGFYVFTTSILGDSGRPVVCRLEANAAGARVGSRAILTPLDNKTRGYGKAAADGASFLIGYNDASTNKQEIAAIRLDAAGALAAGPTMVTSGHGWGTGMSAQTAANPKTLRLGAGFVALWTDRVSSTLNQLQAAIVDGSGAVVKKASLAPPNVGRYAAVSTGTGFAVVLRSGNTIQLWRFDAGANVVGQTQVSNIAYDNPVGIDFSGEAYGLVWTEPNADELGRVAFQRFGLDGSPLGTKVLLGVETPDFDQNIPYVQWTGKGWAVVWNIYNAVGTSQDDLYYGFVDPAGNVTIPVMQITFSEYPPFQRELVWSGSVLGVLRGESRPESPPGSALYFLPLGLDGFKTNPEKKVAEGAVTGLNQTSMYWKGDRFGLVYQQDDPDSLREIEIDPDGVVLPGLRTLTNRGGTPSVAWNGVTLGISWLQLRELYFETDGCAADATPPPCPSLQAAFDGTSVSLSWAAAPDGESGCYRYTVYRDGVQLAENESGSMTFVDSGAPSGLCTYEVRTLSGAFVESEGCAIKAISTRKGDANGDGSLNVSDVLYLINHLFAGGPAPQGYSDANHDGTVNVSDVLYLINHLFAGGPPPV